MSNNSNTLTIDDNQVIEQAKRILAKKFEKFKKEPKLCSPDDVRNFFMLKLALVEHELFYVLFLNNQNQVIQYEELFRGTINEITIYSREVAKRVLHYNASSVILIHNHPSGDPKASPADINITKQLRYALELIDVKVLDHLLVAGDKTVSFKEQGIL